MSDFVLVDSVLHWLPLRIFTVFPFRKDGHVNIKHVKTDQETQCECGAGRLGQPAIYMEFVQQ